MRPKHVIDPARGRLGYIHRRKSIDHPPRQRAPQPDQEVQRSECWAAADETCQPRQRDRLRRAWESAACLSQVTNRSRSVSASKGCASGRQVTVAEQPPKLIVRFCALIEAF